MKLTGKARESFIKWGNKEYYQTVRHYHDIGFIQWFDSLPKPCQYGVIVDWFDSVGICVDNDPEDEESINDLPTFEHDDPIIKGDTGDGIETRPQARQKAIERAIEIYNNK